MGTGRAPVPPSALPGISPTRGEIGLRRPPGLLSPTAPVMRRELQVTHRWCLLRISPFVGEMPGRAEGGVAGYVVFAAIKQG
ncbi:hypothetical protein CO676_13415 [Sinorhizobium sp. BJ1]|nr:hypothetical protein CO676_13415 [Sinorhizobium sp. BJ1]